MSACADMCRDMPTLWVLAKPITSTLFRCRHLGCAGMCQHRETCRHVPTCAINVTCDINLDTSYSDHLDVIQMLTCVSTGGNADMSWYVPTCADMCRHMPTCETTLLTSDTNHLNLIFHAGMCQHIWTCRHVLICADMCWHVPTCDINLDTSYSDHLDLI